MMGLLRWQFDSTNAAVARTPRLSKCSNSKGEKGQMAFLDIKTEGIQIAFFWFLCACDINFDWEGLSL